MLDVAAPSEFRFDGAFQSFPISGSSLLLTLEFSVLLIVPEEADGSEPDII
mgnify:CR=1 FL=1